jgi:hypothetical protein
MEVHDREQELTTLEGARRDYSKRIPHKGRGDRYGRNSKEKSGNRKNQ